MAVELFRPHIAIAFGRASSFADSRASSFSMKDLFTTSFDTPLSSSLLGKLKLKLPEFGRFSSFDLQTSQPMDPITFEVFDVKNYLPEIQYSLDLTPSIEFAVPTFKAGDIYDALVPDSTLTIKSMGKFVKKKIISKITAKLDGLFSVKLDIPTEGLTIDTPELGANISLGSYSESSTQLFPPTLDVDKVEDFDFDFDIDLVDGKLVVDASFAMNVVGVNPLNALADVAGTLSNILEDQSSNIGDVAEQLGSSLDSAATFFQDLAGSDKITLQLNATIDLSVNIGLSLDSFAISSSLNELKSSIVATFEDDYSTEISGVNVAVAPSILLYLEAYNTAVIDARDAGTTVDVFQTPSALTQFGFGGLFDARVTVGINDLGFSLLASDDDMFDVLPRTCHIPVNELSMRYTTNPFAYLPVVVSIFLFSISHCKV